MSEESVSSPESSSEPTSEPAPRARKTATRAPRKAAKSARSTKTAKEKVEAPSPIPEAAVEVTPFPITAEAPATVSLAQDSSDSQDGPAAIGAEWPEPDAETSGGTPGQGEGGKRKRRRRKGKGQGQGGQAGIANGDENVSAAEARPGDATRDQSSRPNQQQPQPQQPQPQHSQQPQQQPTRSRIDPENLAKMAWKIYLAEVSEEGVALIADNDAKDLSRRCFRLAEIFIEEQSRRR